MKRSWTTREHPPPMPVRRFAGLGLAGNPFRVMWKDEVLERLMDADLMPAAEAHLRDGAVVIEVVGQSGWGKTTCLAALRHVGEERLHEKWVAHYCRPEDTRIRLPQGPLDCWCIDEAQRVGPAHMRGILKKRVARGDFRLVVATHSSIAQVCRSLGVDCATIHLSPPTGATIVRFVGTRIRAALRSGLDSPRLAPAAADLLDRQTAGNLHLVEEILYEVFQGFVEGGELPATIGEDDVAGAIQRRASAY